MPHNSLLGKYVISAISIICMGLLISRPSVFVWGPEACLSAVFVERRLPQFLAVITQWAFNYPGDTFISTAVDTA